MGSLKNIHLPGLQKRFNVPFFFETGTWKGDGLAYAAETGFEKLYSSEVVDEFAKAARNRFVQDPRITIVARDSISALRENLPLISGNCIFWLDAHYPAADEGLKGYNAESREEIRLPLEQEVRLIANRIGKFNDILIIDDLRIYEDGPYQYGNTPNHIIPPKNRSVKFIEDLFGQTHEIIRSYKSEGYLFVIPKNGIAETLLQKLQRKLNGKII